MLQEWFQELRHLAPTAPQQKIEQLLSCSFALLSKESQGLGFPDFPVDNLPTAAIILVKTQRNPLNLYKFYDFSRNKIKIYQYLTYYIVYILIKYFLKMV